MFEQSKSESRQGRINQSYRKEILQKELNNMEIEANRAKQGAKTEERTRRVGTKPAEKIIEGSTDRLNAIPYDAKKYANISSQDQEAYHEGFFEHGNRELNGKLESLNEERLKAIGYNDYISGIDAKKLPTAVRNNPYYNEGYLFALIAEEKPKHR